MAAFMVYTENMFLLRFYAYKCIGRQIFQGQLLLPFSSNTTLTK